MDSQLVGVVLGGLIAAISGALAPWLQHKLSADERKKQLRRESVLQLIDAIYSYDLYIDRIRDKTMFASEVEPHPNPMPLIYALIVLEFPQHRLAHRQLDAAASKLIAYFYEQAHERATNAKINLDGYRDLYPPYTEARERLLSVIAGREPLPSADSLKLPSND